MGCASAAHCRRRGRVTERVIAGQASEFDGRPRRTSDATAVRRAAGAGRAVARGTSRKSTIGTVRAARRPPSAFGTAATVALAITAGDIVRAHFCRGDEAGALMADAVVRGWPREEG
jgi:hypothetical protein